MSSSGGKRRPFTKASAGRVGSSLTTNDAVEIAVAEIRQLSRLASMNLALSVGEIIFKRIFASDVELMHRNGPKDVSFVRLAHAGLPMSATALWRSLSTYELSLRYPQLKRSTHLGVSHVREVLGLPPKLQEKLLSRAEREEWSVEEVSEHASKHRLGQGGRPRKLEILRTLDTLRHIASLPLDEFSDRRIAAKYSVEEAEVALTTLSELEERFQALRKLLRDVIARG